MIRFKSVSEHETTICGFFSLLLKQKNGFEAFRNGVNQFVSMIQLDLYTTVHMVLGYWFNIYNVCGSLEPKLCCYSIIDYGQKDLVYYVELDFTVCFENLSTSAAKFHETGIFGNQSKVVIRFTACATQPIQESA